MVLTNSKFSCQLMADSYGVAARPIYPGIDSTLFCPGGGSRGDYVFSVGALLYSKGYRFLISAIGRIAARLRPPLVVAANVVDPAEDRDVRELADCAGVDLHIERVTSDSKLVEMYRGALAFVYAPMSEALGLAPLEAMACGTPVVAVGEGGVTETVVDGVTGWLVDRDADAFAERLTGLLSDSVMRQQMGDAGVQYVRSSWTWQAAVDNLESALAAASSSRAIA
jgi:glycosyltransferase involved in cell wall biosynthesis